MIKVLVTDASFSHSVSAIQSLGKTGFKVVTIGTEHNFLREFGSYSKYCFAFKKVPPYIFEKEHIEAIIDFAITQKVDVILPISSEACSLYSRYIDTFKKAGIKTPITSWEEGMNIASDKYLTFKFARSINFPIPKTFFYNGKNHIESIKKYISFPMVIKGPEGANVRYVDNGDELEYSIRYFRYNFPNHNLLIQEYIKGEGHGYYALCKKGEVLCQFMHKRIMEYPITGGPSVVAQAFYDKDLENLGRKFLSALQWNGVGMVEFKYDKRDGIYKLMEFNPKFWGSLILSIKSGVNFPLCAVRMALGEDFEPVLEYKKGLVCHWPFPGEISLIAGFPFKLFKIPGILMTNKNSVNLSFSDPIPSILQISFGFGTVLKRIWQGKLRYPYGKPRRNLK